MPLPAPYWGVRFYVEPEYVAETSSFSLGFKITLAVVSILSGLMLSLWASTEIELWKWYPAIFCFAIAGTVVLPKLLAIVCGYFISVTVVAMSVWYLYLGFFSDAELGNTVQFAYTYGLPALGFILYRQLPNGNKI